MPSTGGLRDNAPDFKLCTRAIRLNPFFEFLYWRMNYHAEHHMHAGVPCYNLKRISQVIAYDMPERKAPDGRLERNAGDLEEAEDRT